MQSWPNNIPGEKNFFLRFVFGTRNLSFTKHGNLFSSLLGFTSAFLWNLFFTDGSGALEDTELSARARRPALWEIGGRAGATNPGLLRND